MYWRGPHASVQATNLDAHMLTGGVAPAATPDRELQVRHGRAVAPEIGGRLLLRYVLPGQLGQFRRGSRNKHFVTPTPYAPGDTELFLALPPMGPRTHVLLIDPSAIMRNAGPRWVALPGRPPQADLRRRPT